MKCEECGMLNGEHKPFCRTGLANGMYMGWACASKR